MGASSEFLFGFPLDRGIGQDAGSHWGTAEAQISKGFSVSETTTFDPSQVEWAEPPSGHGQWRRTGGGSPRKSKHQDFLDQLQAHPRQWAIFRRDAITGKNQDLRSFRELQVKNVPNGDGTSTVYARWVGLDANGDPDLDPEDKEAWKARQLARQQAQATREANAQNGTSDAA